MAKGNELVSEVRLISNNIKYNAIDKAITFAISFILFPFIVSHVGKEIYGAYILVMTFTGYLGIMDFGVTGAIVKYVAEFKGEGDYKKVNEIISASFSFYVLVGVVAAILLFIISFYFDHLFKVEASNRLIVRELFWVAAGASLLIWPGRTFEGVLAGLQCYKWIALNNIIASVLTGLAAYYIFINNFGMLYYLMISYLFIVLKYLSAYLVLSIRYLKYKIVFPYFYKETYRTIFGFSFYIFLGAITNIFIFHFDNLVIGSFVSVAAVTLYNVAYNLQNGFRMINSLIGSPLVPACAEMEGRNDYPKQKLLLIKGTKYMTFIFVPMVIITIIFTEPFIIHWMGEDFRESILATQVLIAFWLFNGTIEVGSGMLTAKGYARLKFKIGLANAILNLSLSLVLARPLGILGVSLGTTIGMLFVEFPLITYYVVKILNITVKEYFILAFRNNLGIYFFSAVLSFLMLKLFPPSNLWMVILEMGVAYLITISTGYSRFLSNEEKKEVRAMVRF